jgi:hypothetical protein
MPLALSLSYSLTLSISLIIYASLTVYTSLTPCLAHSLSTLSQFLCLYYPLCLSHSLCLNPRINSVCLSIRPSVCLSLSLSLLLPLIINPIALTDSLQQSVLTPMLSGTSGLYRTRRSLPASPILPRLCNNARSQVLHGSHKWIILYNNDYSSIIDIYFYDTFSTLTQTFSTRAQLFRHPV